MFLFVCLFFNKFASYDFWYMTSSYVLLLLRDKFAYITLLFDKFVYITFYRMTNLLLLLYFFFSNCKRHTRWSICKMSIWNNSISYKSIESALFHSHQTCQTSPYINLVSVVLVINHKNNPFSDIFRCRQSSLPFVFIHFVYAL